MCDFCENIKNYDEYGNHWYAGGVLYNAKEKEYCLAQNDSEYDFNDYLDINYCPLCGRKLSEETEN